MSYRIDLSLPANEILIKRINYIYDESYQPEDILFNENGTVPLSRRDRYEKGVESKVRAEFYKEWLEGREFYLTRGDLDRLLDGLFVEVPIGDVSWSHDLAPYINQQLGLNLKPLEIMIEPLPEDLTSYTVKLIPRHLSLKGTIHINFIDPTPRKLGDLISKNELDGFTIGDLHVYD